MKINGVDLDTSTEQEPEIPDYPPPQPPSSEPPIEQKGETDITVSYHLEQITLCMEECGGSVVEC